MFFVNLVQEKPAEDKKPEAPKAAAEEKKEEAPKAAEDGKKEAEAPPPPQEIVLKVFMHCEGCARKVRRCLKGFEGVENAITDCRASKVVVKGERADPMKVFKRVQRKSHRQPSVITVVLGVYMHCDACAQEIRKRILRMKGIESAEANLANSQVTVKGVMEPKALADYVYKKTGKHAAIVKVDPEKKEEEKAKEEKKSEGEKSDAKKPEEEGKETKSGEAATAEEEDLKMELRKNEMYYNYYQQHRYVHEQMNAQTQMFSDDNPNACVVM
ncbi:hypothetical protein SASPL_138741 [Salvia splendens]|uniref:HMA domain-containing protein n=1 Tax=Salvia splendens TaxID=180675 RepID=A0A8X8WVB1_SALSN|nr:hypothetical protein SASPL_138741 [Salvia splendens]